jgi:CRISPR-associated protein Cas2
MMTLVIYDIEDDRVRHRVSEACKDYGLRRIQKSAFRGQLNTNRCEMLYQRLTETLGRRAGSIHIYVVCDRDARAAVEIEQAGRATGVENGEPAARDESAARNEGGGAK